jgi:predicted AlkP superfamily phosphohydrolase/phosphomutase
MRRLQALVILLIAVPCICGTPRRVVVLGVDGMDYEVARRMQDAGQLPNLSAIASDGAFVPLKTTIPPQSPVAWSTFTAGAGAGTHGIADFIERDELDLLPRFSMSRVTPSGLRLNIGSYSFPLRSGTVELLRTGTPFWDYLCDHGIPGRILRVPANFPPQSKCASMECLAGMGTPDLLGSYGTFTYFTSDPKQAGREAGGGVIRLMAMRNGAATGQLPGPANEYRSRASRTSVELKFFCDATTDAVKIELPGTQLVLAKGEWSGWVPVEFPMLGSLAGARGICRFLVRSVHPHLNVYVSPVNIDPMHPALPISFPAKMSRRLAESVGRFHTQGMPEDTKALSAGVLDDEEFYAQAQWLLDESIRMLRFELDQCREGFLFFYFSATDQCSHAFWRQFDTQSVNYNADFAARHGNPVEQLYERIDGVVGKVRVTLNRPDDVLLVMSDHGFAAFKREVELNQWLRKEGYLVVKPEARLRNAGLGDIDWANTRAYNIGLNSIYINMAGRESSGIVAKSDAPPLMKEIARRLEALKDFDTGTSVVSRVWLGRETYAGPHVDELPDLIVGFRPPYRISWRSAVGEIIAGPICKTNTDKWSGDHCVDPEFVPGVLFSSVRLRPGDASLQDMAPTVLGLYGIDTPAQMAGRPLIEEAVKR